MKIVFVGDSPVGKSTIISRILDRTENRFPIPTVNLICHEYDMKHDGKNVRLTLFDTPGGVCFRCLIRLWLRGASVVVFVYSEENHRQSFAEIPKWVSEVENVAEIPHFIIVGNKSDLRSSADAPDLSAFRDKNGARTVKWIQTSAITGQGIDDLVAMIAECAESAESAESIREAPAAPVVLDLELDLTQPQRIGCC